MRRSRPHLVPYLAALVACSLLLSACTGPGSGSQVSTEPGPTIVPIEVKVAFMADYTVENPYGLVTPAMQGLKLAFSSGAQSPSLPVHAEVVAFDTQGDPARALDLAAEIADDPSYVAVVIGPFWQETPDVAALLLRAGLPTFSLSSLGPALGSGGGWWRTVPDSSLLTDLLVAEALSGEGAPNGVCLIGDGSGTSDRLEAELAARMGDAVALRASLPPGSPPVPVELQIAASGCGTVLWSGFSSGAIALRTALHERGLGHVGLIVSEASKDEAFLTGAGPAGEGTIALCGCVDLSTSTDQEAQSFVHDFQAASGSSPGVYAVEGYDIGGMMLRAFRGGLSTRELLMRVYVTGPGPYVGLAGHYSFAADGDLESSAQGIRLFRDQGLTWVPVQKETGSSRLPVRTPGVLIVGSCRAGAPYAYRRNGSATGFDVDLADAVAERLGLSMQWVSLACRDAPSALEKGRVDVLMTSANGLDPQTLISRVSLSVRIAVTMPGRQASRAEPLNRLTSGDVVGVIRAGDSAQWAGRRFVGSDAPTLRDLSDATLAYDLLESGELDAVVDVEWNAWRMTEDRPGLRVVASEDTGDHSVFIAAGPDTVLLGAIDSALAVLIRSSDYGRLFAEYFPGATLPGETGS